MSTHAAIGIRYPNGKIDGCYVHYDGATMEVRINNYLNAHTTTCLSLLIAKAQASGGFRSFYTPTWEPGPGVNRDGLPESDFLDDNEPYIIDEHNWDFDHMGANYRYLIEYDTGKVHASSKY